MATKKTTPAKAVKSSTAKKAAPKAAAKPVVAKAPAKAAKAAPAPKKAQAPVKAVKAAPAPKKVAAPAKAVKAAPAAKKVAPKAAKKELKEVVFNVYSPDSKVVEVAGEFNSWTPAKMKKGEEGVWSLKKSLAAGSYQYKFVFDGSWEIDQANPDRVPDGQGGENSVKNV